MKITKSRLKQIITEELQNILAEEDDQDDPFADLFNLFHAVGGSSTRFKTSRHSISRCLQSRTNPHYKTER